MVKASSTTKLHPYWWKPIQQLSYIVIGGNQFNNSVTSYLVEASPTTKLHPNWWKPVQQLNYILSGGSQFNT